MQIYCNYVEQSVKHWIMKYIFHVSVFDETGDIYKLLDWLNTKDMCIFFSKTCHIYIYKFICSY